MTASSPPAAPEQQPPPDPPGSPQVSPMRARIGTMTAALLSWSRGHRVLAAASALGLVVIIVLAVVLLTGGPMTVNGSLLDQSALFGDTCNAQAGSQVLITGPSGQVLVVTTLHENTKIEKKLEAAPSAKELARLNNGLNAFSGGAAVDVIGYYTFTASVPAGQSAYGIKVAGGHAVWFTPSQMAKGPGLTCK
jgi:hypothetical protein